MKDCGFYWQLRSEGFTDEEADEIITEVVDCTEELIEEYGSLLTDEHRQKLREKVYEAYNPIR